MVPALMGLTGKFKALLNLITPSRAANLDNIDAAIMARLDANVSTVKAVRKTQVITSSTVWIKPAGVESAHVILVGAGGGGGSINQGGTDRAGGGGGGGQVIERDLILTGDLTITIGAGGLGGAWSADTNANPGSSGGDSTITGGASLTAYGGTGGGGGSLVSAQKPGVSGNGNTGGSGGYQTNVIAGSGAGAGGPAVTPNAIHGAYHYPGVSNFGFRGGWAYSNTEITPNQPGPGVKGLGGGGVGGTEFAQDNASYGGLCGSPSDGGGAAGLNSAGGDAVANTGGGGGGAHSITTISFAGGNGADGLCILTWDE